MLTRERSTQGKILEMSFTKNPIQFWSITCHLCDSSDEKWRFEEKDNTEKNLAYIKALRSLQAVDRETAEKVNDIHCTDLSVFSTVFSNLCVLDQIRKVNKHVLYARMAVCAVMKMHLSRKSA